MEDLADVLQLQQQLQLLQQQQQIRQAQQQMLRDTRAALAG